VLVAIEPGLATIEPERSLVELTVARVEPAVEPLRTRPIVLIHTGIPALDPRVCTVDSGLTVIEASLGTVVVRRGGRNGHHAGHETGAHDDGEGGLPRRHELAPFERWQRVRQVRRAAG
jgi:hypothetical protein